MKGFLVTLLLFLLGMMLSTEAFIPSSSSKATTKTIHQPLEHQSPACNNRYPVISLQAYKKKREPLSVKEEKKDTTPPLSIFINYMTPWRNPNSIFVYMFLILYILGSYSEAKSAAGM